ncbi:choline dehydrogenase [Annulohypoxylon maeteangense]|uniref:choline dehydrogenase n=1 Tax=Annulohypoxylon maeteangense TaxID=1927788 RepID=UPI00200722DD|nr:choline dehydrogenase [Annulohypoxylon maeteangense]KAI0887816.1 choline dehydrogenase [Annulohypoxylon maeteangense]
MILTAALAFLNALVCLAAANAAIDVTVPRTPVQNDYPPNGPQLPANPPGNKTYEYIVVGSGAGGSPLAARLALAGHSVLLIDAGGDYGAIREVEVPSLYIGASERNELNWGYFTRHYTNETQTKRDRKLTYLTPNGEYYSGVNPPKGSKMLGNYYPRVGGLGGCTEHLALLAVLPANDDWEYIKNLTGDKNWGARNMRGYFKMMEKNQYLSAREDVTKAHGFSGWLSTTIEPMGLFTPDIKMDSIFLSAASSRGLDTSGLLKSIQQAVGSVATKVLASNSTASIANSLSKLLAYDINNNSPDRDRKDTLARIPLSINSPDWKRSSPRDLVYKIATAKNANGSKKYRLDIALHTLATKVVFNTKGAKPKATGIEYLYGEALYRADPRSNSTHTGTPGSVRASREVILAGGAFNTPQLLKLSGIGPASELKAHKIPLVKNLPGVGGNLQDRYEIGVSAAAPQNFTLFANCTFITTADDPCYASWAHNGNTNSSNSVTHKPVNGNGSDPAVLARGPYATNGLALGLWTRSSVAGRVHDLWAGGVPGLFQGYFPGMSQTVVTPSAKNYFTWLVLKAHSRNNGGTVNLTSADPRDTPEITFRSFGEGSVRGEELAKLDLKAAVEGMKWGIRVFEKVREVGGVGVERVWPPESVRSDEEIEEWVRDEAWGHHASCTCPIGADGDPLAVLDGQLRVRGVAGLRVVDASAFPKIPGTFPAVAIYQLAYKAAEDILADARR